MDNVVLFETTQGYYGIYDTVSELLYDRVGREIYDINDILYKYNYLMWNREYKDMCIEGCEANCLTVQRLKYESRDIIVAFTLDGDKHCIMIEFV
jgi:hypothetical protein